MSDWRHKAACADEDAELFFPIGTSGPAVLQIAEAKTVCRRCPVVDICLQDALNRGLDHGVFGGMSEDERRTMKRRNARTRTRTGGAPAAPVDEDEVTRRIRQLAKEGWSDSEIGKLIGKSPQMVQRIRSRAGIPPGLPPGGAWRRRAG